MNFKDKVSKVEGGIRDKQMELSNRLQVLQSRFPAELAAYHLGEITETEVNGIRREIETTELFLREVPLLLEGLAKRREALERDELGGRRQKRREKAFQEYEALKAEIATMRRYDRGIEVRLFGLASDCGKRGAAEEIVKLWKHRLDGIPAQNLGVS